MTAPHELFASCAPGLEPLLAAELGRLGALTPEVQPGGVAARGHRAVLHRVLLESGLASHLLVRVARFHAAHFAALERELQKLPWEDLLVAGRPRRVRVTSRKSRLYHGDAVAERVERVVAGRLGGVDTGAEAEPEVPIHVRLVRDRAEISIDLAGEPLHRRGYRKSPGAAPLREDLARALLVASGWDPATPLLDPLCGSGTIAIEAATLARALAPGRLRAFALRSTALFHEPTWQRLREEAEARALPEAPSPIVAADRDRAALDAARANAERAGVRGDLTLSVATLSALELEGVRAAGHGALVTNPPYGRRLGSRGDLAPLYRALGRRAGELPAGWSVALVCTERRLGHLVASDLKTAFVTDAGGTKVRALVRAGGAPERREPVPSGA